MFLWSKGHIYLAVLRAFGSVIGDHKLVLRGPYEVLVIKLGWFMHELLYSQSKVYNTHRNSRNVELGFGESSLD